MKQLTNKLFKTEAKKHSIIFKPMSIDSPIVSSIYIMRTAVPDGATECKLTISWPEGGQDEAYLKI